MRKITILILVAIGFLTACNHSETVRATGESENWKGNLRFELNKTGMNDIGGIEYIGDEELVTISYSIETAFGSETGEVNAKENQTAVSFGMGGNNNVLTKEEATRILNAAYIDINWETNEGKYSETIELEVE